MKKNLMTLAIAMLSFYGAIAQMITPQASPKSITIQRVGITDVTITYHRPAVKEREIWGTRLAPYDAKPFPWRAGANDNTIIETTHDLLVVGEKLPAGKYGFHIIPKESGKWTVIFSKNATSWGSFRYNPEEDALRVDVQPQENSHQEHLLYHFTNLTNDGATIALDWEKKRIPISFKVDNIHEVVLSYYDDMLRGSAGFNWNGWFDKAIYCDMNNTHLEEGLQAVNTSIRRYPKWDNYSAKENILRKLDRNDEADQVLHDKIHKIATGSALNMYGYQLLGQNKHEEALEIFQLNIEKNPEEPNFYDSLGECYKLMGDKKNAVKSYKKALAMNPPQFVKDNAIKMLKELGVDYNG